MHFKLSTTTSTANKSDPKQNISSTGTFLNSAASTATWNRQYCQFLLKDRPFIKIGFTISRQDPSQVLNSNFVIINLTILPGKM